MLSHVEIPLDSERGPLGKVSSRDGRPHTVSWCPAALALQWQSWGVIVETLAHRAKNIYYLAFSEVSFELTVLSTVILWFFNLNILCTVAEV